MTPKSGPSGPTIVSQFCNDCRGCFGEAWGPWEGSRGPPGPRGVGGKNYQLCMGRPASSRCSSNFSWLTSNESEASPGTKAEEVHQRGVRPICQATDHRFSELLSQLWLAVFDPGIVMRRLGPNSFRRQSIFACASSIGKPLVPSQGSGPKLGLRERVHIIATTASLLTLCNSDVSTILG